MASGKRASRRTGHPPKPNGKGKGTPKQVLRACKACTQAANGVRQPTHGRGVCPFKDLQGEQREQRLADYKAVTRAARDQLVADRRTKLDEGLNSPAPTLSTLSTLSDLPPSDFPPSSPPYPPLDNLSDTGTASTRAEDWEEGRRAAESGLWLDLFYDEETGGAYEAENEGAYDDETGGAYEAEDTRAYDEEIGGAYEAENEGFYDDETGSGYEGDYLDEYFEFENGENGENGGEDADGTVWIYDEDNAVEGDPVVEEGAVADDNNVEEDEVDDSLIRPISSDDSDALAALPFYQISCMLSKVYDSTKVRGVNIPSAVKRIRNARNDLSKEQEVLPNLLKGTRSDVKLLEGVKHASPYCREERVLKKWLSIAARVKASKTVKNVDKRGENSKGADNGGNAKVEVKSNKWHDVAPQFASACSKLESLSDWAPSWAFITLLPKDGSGQMYSWASESVMAEKPELVEVMRRTMFGELRALRKQAAEELEQERLDLAQQRTNAEARLRRLKAQLAEANTTIAEQSDAHKQLLKMTELWKARAMTGRDA